MEADQITRKAKSNLAFALRVLPAGRREDMVLFYAFCRTLDDLADQLDQSPDWRREQLCAWRDGLMGGFSSPNSLQSQVEEMIERCELPRELLAAIAEGCLMDLGPVRYRTWENLSEYIWKVSCAVGLVSIRLFGCVDPKSEAYAVALGHALQLTNIMRDVREDYENGARIYLPQEDLERFGYEEKDVAQRCEDRRFQALMEVQAERALRYFREAAELMPEVDRKALLPARIMAAVYESLLHAMIRDGFGVFRKRYKVSLLRKLWIVVRYGLFG